MNALFSLLSVLHFGHLPLAQTPSPPPQAAAIELPPWIQVNQTTLEAMYNRGIADAGRGIPLSQIEEKTRRDIGPADNPFPPGEADGYVWVVDPFVQAYAFGWRARHDDWTSEQIKSAHDQLVAWGAQGRKRLTFQVILNVYRPSPSGPVAAARLPEVFRDIQVQLKVAGRRYEPERQPGDLVRIAGTPAITSLGSRIVPRPFSGTPSGPGEIDTGSLVNTNDFTVYRTDKVDFYQGNFTVVFDLYDSDGTPRVRPKDVSVGAIVITAGGNEHQAVYTWNELMDLRLPSKR